MLSLGCHVMACANAGNGRVDGMLAPAAWACSLRSVAVRPVVVARVVARAAAAGGRVKFPDPNSNLEESREFRQTRPKPNESG